MKTFLMYKDQDFEKMYRMPVNEQALTQDLELDTLFNAMSLGDKFIYDVARKTVLSSLRDGDSIFYRQAILKDCIKNPSLVRTIYDIAMDAIDAERKEYLGILAKYPSSILSRSVKVMKMFVTRLKRLKSIADDHADKFYSDGFTRFFCMVREELDHEYFASVERHLRNLEFQDGVLISAQLGKGNKGVNYRLHQPDDKKPTWVQRLFRFGKSDYMIYIDDRDERGARALSELRDRGLNLVANALAQSVDHILSFFNMLRTELAFYIGCLNLYEKLELMKEPVCFPGPLSASERMHSFVGLYDLCLALTLKGKVVGNDVEAVHKDLIIITGANQGGKSTFLRSIGLSQLMMQCGMFVPAKVYRANICTNLFTHFKREEDSEMNSGKLDEELSRMRDIADHLCADSMVLFNESFAATNEREGSEVARQIICALIEKRIKVFFVTHLYDFARGYYNKQVDNVLFLRAQRQSDGERSFKMMEGEPLQTSYGVDIYKRIFAASD